MPQYDTLKVEAILNFLKDHKSTFKFLPDKEDLHKVPKQWLVNIVYSIVQEDFSKWVRKLIESRNEKLVSEKDALLEMDPQIAEVFARSTAISQSKGIGANSRYPYYSYHSDHLSIFLNSI